MLKNTIKIPLNMYGHYQSIERWYQDEYCWCVRYIV